jgi:hypothetical protein
MYVIVARPNKLESIPGEVLVIRDVSSETGGMTITNSAEDVVRHLQAKGRLRAGMRLFYYDTDNNLDEILISGNGFFKGFALGPQ